MKKNILTLAACGLILSSCGVAKNAVTNKIENKIENKITSMKDLIGLGKEQVCEWENEKDSIKSKGKLWIKGSKFRQTMMSKMADKPEVNMEIISDGDWIYMWNSTSKEQGMKIKMTEEQKGDMGKLTNGSLDLGKEIDFKCSSTNIDDSQMMAPTDVKFMDLEALQNQFSKLIPSGVEMPKTDGE